MPAGTPGAGLASLGSARSSSASVSAAHAGSGPVSRSFHANWQAQLASLGGAIQSLSSESREILDGPDPAQAPGGEPPGNRASPTGLLIRSLAAQSDPVSTKQVLSAVLPARPASDSRAPVMAGRSDAPAQADTPVHPTAATTASGGASSSAETTNPAHKTKSQDAKPTSRAGPPHETISTPPPGMVAAAVLASQSATPVAMVAGPAVSYVEVAPQAAQAGYWSPAPAWSANNGVGVRPSDSSLPAQQTDQISSARTHAAPGTGIASAASGSESLTEDSPELPAGTGPPAAQGDAQVKVAEAVAFPEPVNLEGGGTQPTGPVPALGTAPSPRPETPEGKGVAPGAAEAIGEQAGARNEVPRQQAGVAATASRNPSSQPAGGLQATLQGTGREVTEAIWAVAAEAAQTGAPSLSPGPATQAGQRTAPGFPDAGSASPPPPPAAGHGAVKPSRLVPEIAMGANEPGLENPGLSSAGAVSLEGPQRTTRSSATDNNSEHRPAPVVAQATGVQGDTSGLMRDPGAARLPIDRSDGARETPPSVTPRETFAALDSGSAPGAPIWTHAGARQAEAGFHDPALGWVGVRAEMSGGAVHASLVPGSAEAAQELGRQMDGLHTYLAAQHTTVESLGLATPGGRDSGSFGNEGWNQQMQQNMQQGAGEGSGQQTYADPEPAPLQAGIGIDRPVAAETSAAAMGGDRGVLMDGNVGNHISLMA